jgi:hypothetical protein
LVPYVVDIDLRGEMGPVVFLRKEVLISLFLFFLCLLWCLLLSKGLRHQVDHLFVLHPLPEGD